jgi:hypothetical protein
VKLVLHIGMPKTGTSTLQRALSGESRVLHQAGILYPSPKGFRVTKSNHNANHNALSCVLLSFDRIHREFRSPGRSLEHLRAYGKEFWDDIEQQVSCSRATTAVLSSEYLFAYSDDEVQALRALLEPLFDEVEVVVYVRHPAEYYLSMMQQKVKASYAIRAPSEFRTRYRICITRYADAFDGRLSVRAFEREALIGGSIVQDFAGHFLPQIPGGPPELDIEEVNTSMSGEAMCIVQSLRRHAWPDQNDVFTPECQHITSVLNEIRDETGQTPPRLKPAIDAGLTIRHRADLLWLQSEFGVVLDHASDPSAPDPDPDEAGWTSTDLLDILDIERGSIARTTALLHKELAARAVAAARSARASKSA